MKVRNDLNGTFFTNPNISAKTIWCLVADVQRHNRPQPQPRVDHGNHRRFGQTKTVPSNFRSPRHDPITFDPRKHLDRLGNFAAGIVGRGTAVAVHVLAIFFLTGVTMAVIGPSTLAVAALKSIPRAVGNEFHCGNLLGWHVQQGIRCKISVRLSSIVLFIYYF